MNEELKDEITFNPLFGYQIPGVPSEEDTITKKKNPNWRMNACLGYQYDENGARIEGFKKAADILVNQVANHGTGQDHLVYPIAALYRHHLELLLKDIIQLGAHLQDKNVTPMGHKLPPLLNKAKSILNEIWPDENSETEFFHIERIISELSELDPDGQNFRYGRRADGKNPLQEVDVINLESLAIAVGKVSAYLSGALTGIWQYISLKYDAESNTQFS